uniref:Uncharacterized protein n=1 Tax=Rhizophagus irregularis (strain DAOM 181602 / DAOM 197198 / MUCL 43194) TaxID=747089 RepID=U9UUA1_RHIID
MGISLELRSEHAINEFWNKRIFVFIVRRTRQLAMIIIIRRYKTIPLKLSTVIICDGETEYIRILMIKLKHKVSILYFRKTETVCNFMDHSKRKYLVIVIIVFSIYYDVNNFSAYISKVRKSEEPPYPKVPGIKKIDVGEGDDTWILTDKNELYHWNRFKKTFLYERNHVFDFAVGSDGSIVYIDVYNSVHIRDSISSWHIIYDSKYYKISRISICDYNTIFLVDTFHNLIKGVYDSGTDHYSWDLTPGHFYQASCAFHDYSLWAICEDYVYLYINKFKK